MKKRTIKSICIITDFLSSGGAEKMAGLLSKSLSVKGYNVSVLSMTDEIDYDYGGDLYVVGISCNEYRGVLPLRKLLKFKRMYNFIGADLYIDFRARYNSINELLFHLFIYKLKKTIFTIHSQDVSNYMPQRHWFFKRYNKAKAVIAVSQGVKQKIDKLFDFSNSICIPNFFSKDLISKSLESADLPKNDYIIAIGRLKNEIKQFDKLILAYSKSKLKDLNIQLCILGEGADFENLNDLIIKNNLQTYVKLLGFKQNPYPYVRNSIFLVLSSKLEGLPMVLIESLALKTPIVAFNCNYGPSEIIINEENGLLVKDQDFEALTEALNTMFTNSELYVKCKNNSQASVNKYSEEVIMKHWLELINT